MNTRPNILTTCTRKNVSKTRTSPYYNTMKERPTLLYTSFKKLSGQRRSTRMDDMRVPHDPFNTPRDTRPRFKANKKYLLRSMRGTQHLQRSSTAPSGVFSEATLGPKFNVKLSPIRGRPATSSSIVSNIGIVGTGQRDGIDITPFVESMSMIFRPETSLQNVKNRTEKKLPSRGKMDSVTTDLVNKSSYKPTRSWMQIQLGKAFKKPKEEAYPKFLGRNRHTQSMPSFSHFNESLVGGSIYSGASMFS